jgi:hypothetical protein
VLSLYRVIDSYTLHTLTIEQILFTRVTQDLKIVCFTSIIQMTDLQPPNLDILYNQQHLYLTIDH